MTTIYGKLLLIICVILRPRGILKNILLLSVDNSLILCFRNYVWRLVGYRNILERKKNRYVLLDAVNPCTASKKVGAAEKVAAEKVGGSASAGAEQLDSQQGLPPGRLLEDP